MRADNAVAYRALSKIVSNILHTRIRQCALAQNPELIQSCRSFALCKMMVIDSFVGPHEGREIELMLAGLKPVSMFVEPVDSDTECFPEEEFDKLVSEGRMVKQVAIEKSEAHGVGLRHFMCRVLPGQRFALQ
jgi:hypothetical protein